MCLDEAIGNQETRFVVSYMLHSSWPESRADHLPRAPPSSTPKAHATGWASGPDPSHGYSQAGSRPDSAPPSQPGCKKNSETEAASALGQALPRRPVPNERCAELLSLLWGEVPGMPSPARCCRMLIKDSERTAQFADLE